MVCNPFSTAREWDQETQLYFYRARYYDAKTGRFISADPIGYSNSFNLYEYARNSPLNWIDPLGLKEKCKYFNQGSPYWKPTSETKVKFDIETQLVDWWITVEEGLGILFIYEYHKYEHRLVKLTYRLWQYIQPRILECWDECTGKTTYSNWAEPTVIRDDWRFEDKEIVKVWYEIKKYLYGLIPQDPESRY